MLFLQSRSSSKAFTLVEVLVVLVILGFAGAIVVPSLSRPSNFSVQSAGRMLISDIMIAQNDAIASQTPRSIVFEPLLNRYRLVDDSGNNLQAVWRAGSGMGETDYLVDFNADGRFTGVTLQNVNIGGGQTLDFDPLGSPANGGTIDLVNANTTYRVSITPFTGRVTIAVVP